MKTLAAGGVLVSTSVTVVCFLLAESYASCESGVGLHPYACMALVCLSWFATVVAAVGEQAR